ncbi:MAG: hypothetical protein A2538_03350 [Candidatus Magasanikbacteria bacterium RIFOXYD2_FULL_41_14]|uniref:VWFA domain-containing protein n=1 Tax=Candidatus Magasanikbacteria bacterium RIFOXYD2_FULL_41_14 TaxID=1798709 RepID=A0A1F6PG82_9BACT|nr:MAG: hypothetical protein A2538_03350 [Candidatus Magasanikbacteria bacterium RIFOXYD2_FULL_41_14]
MSSDKIGPPGFEMATVGKSEPTPPTPERDHSLLAEKYRNLQAVGQIFVGAVAYQVLIDPDCDTYSFSHTDRTMRVSPQLIEKHGLNDLEQLYIYCHELAHLSQLTDDPDSYVESFEVAKTKAKKYASVSETGEELIETKNQQIAQQMWDRFFNIFLDVHANARVKARMPVFQQRDQNGRLVEEKLYTKSFSVGAEQAWSDQFLNLALFGQMVPTGDIGQLHPEVATVFNTPIAYLGRKFANLGVFIRECLADPNLNVAHFFARLRRVVEPVFEKLLDADIEAGRINAKSANKNRIGVGAPIDQGSARKIAGEIKKARQSRAQRASDAILEKFKQAGLADGFNERDILRQIEIMKATDEVFRSMVSIWESFIKLIANIKYVEQGGHRSGKNFSVVDFIRQLPDFLTNPDALRVFTREYASEERPDFRPKKISLYLITDLSSSMDSNKKRAVQEAGYAFIKSLIQYRRNLMIDLPENNNQFPLAINVRAIGFGSSAVDLLPPTATELENGQIADGSDLDKRLWKMIKDINDIGLGGTDDSLPLEIVCQDVQKPDCVARLEQGDELVVVLEITDGDTINPDASQGLVDKLNGLKNVYAHAIKIEGPIYAEDRPVRLPSDSQAGDDGEDRAMPSAVADTGKFEQVWGKNGAPLTDLLALKKVALKILAQAITDHQEVQ